MIQRFLSDSIAYGLTTVMSRATMLVALLVMPLILSPRDYGALSMIVTVTALVAILAPLEVSHGLGRYYDAADPDEKKAYTSTAWTFLLIMLAGLLTLGQMLAPPLCRLILGDDAYLPSFRVALVMMALNCLFYFLQNQCRWEFRTAQFVLLSLTFSFLTLAASLALALMIDPPLMGVMIGQTVGALVAVCLGSFALLRSLAIELDRSKLCKMLHFSLPLVPASVSLFFSVHASRIALSWMESLDAVGFYALAVQIAGIATLGIVGVQFALTPLVIAHHEASSTPRHLARLFEAFVGYGIIASLVLGFFAPDLIRLLWGRQYAGVGPLVLILAPAVLIAQMYLFAPGFMIAKRTDLQMWVSFAGAAVAIVGNIALVPAWGTIGAAAATLLSALVFLSLWLLFTQRLYPLPLRWGTLAASCLAGIVLVVASEFAAASWPAASVFIKLGATALAGQVVWRSRLVPVGAALAALKTGWMARSRRSRSA